MAHPPDERLYRDRATTSSRSSQADRATTPEPEHRGAFARRVPVIGRECRIRSRIPNVCLVGEPAESFRAVSTARRLAVPMRRAQRVFRVTRRRIECLHLHTFLRG